MMNGWFFTFILLFVCFLIQINCKFKRICYLRVDESNRIDVSLINSSLCTHIILCFATAQNGTIAPNDQKDLIYYRNVTQLKKKFPELKIMLSVGGGGDDRGFHQICANQTNIDKFVFSVMQMMINYELDGLDIDWEFPAWNTQYPEDKENFNNLLKELSTHFSRQENRVENRRKLLLSVAVSAIVNIVDQSYDVPEMAKYVDFVNIMTYDFHMFSKYWPFTGYNAPLYGRKVEKSYFTYLNTNRSVNYWNVLGMSKEKILVGIPTYGHTYQLASTQHTGPDSAAIAQKSDVSFSQVCQLMTNSSTHISFDSESMVPYLYNGDLWVSYDDIQSVKLKAEWIRDNQYAGSMTFDLNADDYQFKCSNTTQFVLHSTIYSILH